MANKQISPSIGLMTNAPEINLNINYSDVLTDEKICILSVWYNSSIISKFQSTSINYFLPSKNELYLVISGD